MLNYIKLLKLMRLKLRIIVLCEIQFFFKWKQKFYLFIYFFTYLLFIYTFLLFLRNLIRAKLNKFGDLENQILTILKTVSTHKGIHTWNEFRLKHIHTWRTLLMLCLNFSTICKRRICNISDKFMIKAKRFSASKKSGAIMFK